MKVTYWGRDGKEQVTGLFPRPYYSLCDYLQYCKLWIEVKVRNTNVFTVRGEDVWMYSPYLTQDHVRFMEKHDRRFRGVRRIILSPLCAVKADSLL